MTATWEAVPGAPDIYRAIYRVPGTTPYSTLINLGNDSYLIFSPGPGLEHSLPDFVSSESKLLLLAPSFSHTLGVAPWCAAQPQAELFAPEAIHTKIAKRKVTTNLQTIGALAAQMPEFVQIHVPPANKFHEVWLSVKQEQTIYWIVCDAFLNFETVEGGFIKKFLLGLYGIKPGLRMHKMFRLSLKDKTAFKQWAEPLFAADARQVLLPCHREIYAAADCRERLRQIVAEVA